jgi:multiple sugar transport system permease protein
LSPYRNSPTRQIERYGALDLAPGGGRAGRPPRSRALALLDRNLRHWTLLPAVILLLALTVYPVANLSVMSVSTIEFAAGEEIWTLTPYRNFQLLLGDRILRTALINTFIFVVVSVAAEMILGFALTILVSSVPRMKGLLRTVMIVPILVPPVAIGSMWKLMYNYEFGIFNQTAAALGLAPIDWLGSPSLALWSVILVDIWHWVPFVFLILFAAVESLPKEVLEAARVDGASTWTIIRKIVIPLMVPALTVAFLFRAILAFKVFDEIFLLTSGGPGTSTEVVSLHLYKVFFSQNQLGYGALLSIAIILATIVFLLASRSVAARVEARNA